MLVCSSLLFRSRNLAVVYLVWVSVTNCFSAGEKICKVPLVGSTPFVCLGGFR